MAETLLNWFDTFQTWLAAVIGLLVIHAAAFTLAKALEHESKNKGHDHD